ncbi:MAG: hypothetical protein ABUL62_18105 [Myxococcales bacterium]
MIETDPTDRNRSVLVLDAGRADALFSGGCYASKQAKAIGQPVLVIDYWVEK